MALGFSELSSSDTLDKNERRKRLLEDSIEIYLERFRKSVRFFVKRGVEYLTIGFETKTAAQFLQEYKPSDPESFSWLNRQAQYEALLRLIGEERKKREELTGSEEDFEDFDSMIKKFETINRAKPLKQKISVAEKLDLDKELAGDEALFVDGFVYGDELDCDILLADNFVELFKEKLFPRNDGSKGNHSLPVKVFFETYLQRLESEWPYQVDASTSWSRTKWQKFISDLRSKLFAANGALEDGMTVDTTQVTAALLDEFCRAEFKSQEQVEAFFRDFFKNTKRLLRKDPDLALALESELPTSNSSLGLGIIDSIRSAAKENKLEYCLRFIEAGGSELLLSHLFELRLEQADEEHVLEKIAKQDSEMFLDNLPHIPLAELPNREKIVATLARHAPAPMIYYLSRLEFGVKDKKIIIDNLIEAAPYLLFQNFDKFFEENFLQEELASIEPRLIAKITCETQADAVKILNELYEVRVTHSVPLDQHLSAVREKAIILLASQVRPMIVERLSAPEEERFASNTIIDAAQNTLIGLGLVAATRDIVEYALSTAGNEKADNILIFDHASGNDYDLKIFKDKRLGYESRRLIVHEYWRRGDPLKASFVLEGFYFTPRNESDWNMITDIVEKSIAAGSFQIMDALCNVFSKTEMEKFLIRIIENYPAGLLLFTEEYFPVRKYLDDNLREKLIFALVEREPNYLGANFHKLMPDNQVRCRHIVQMLVSRGLGFFICFDSPVEALSILRIAHTGDLWSTANTKDDFRQRVVAIQKAKKIFSPGLWQIIQEAKFQYVNWVAIPEEGMRAMNLLYEKDPARFRSQFLSAEYFSEFVFVDLFSRLTIADIPRFELYLAESITLGSRLAHEARDKAVGKILQKNRDAHRPYSNFGGPRIDRPSYFSDEEEKELAAAKRIEKYQIISVDTRNNILRLCLELNQAFEPVYLRVQRILDEMGQPYEFDRICKVVFATKEPARNFIFIEQQPILFSLFSQFVANKLGGDGIAQERFLARVLSLSARERANFLRIDFKKLSRGFNEGRVVFCLLELYEQGGILSFAADNRANLLRPAGFASDKKDIELINQLIIAGGFSPEDDLGWRFWKAIENDNESNTFGLLGIDFKSYSLRYQRILEKPYSEKKALFEELKKEFLAAFMQRISEYRRDWQENPVLAQFREFIEDFGLISVPEIFREYCNLKNGGEPGPTATALGIQVARAPRDKSIQERNAYLLNEMRQRIRKIRRDFLTSSEFPHKKIDVNNPIAVSLIRELVDFDTSEWRRDYDFTQFIRDFYVKKSEGKIAPLPTEYLPGKINIALLVGEETATTESGLTDSADSESEDPATEEKETSTVDIHISPDAIKRFEQLLESFVVISDETPEAVFVRIKTRCLAEIEAAIDGIREKITHPPEKEQDWPAPRQEKARQAREKSLLALRRLSTDVSGSENPIVVLLKYEADNNVTTDLSFTTPFIRQLISLEALTQVPGIRQTISDLHTSNDGEYDEKFWLGKNKFEKLLELIKNAVKQHAIPGLNLEKKEQVRLAKILNANAIEDEVSRLNKISSGKVKEFLVVPSRDILAETSGYYADACWTAQSNIMEENPNMLSVTFVANPEDDVSRRIAGGCLLIETTINSGEKALVIRGLNPKQNIITQLSAEGFVDSFVDNYLVNICRARGIKHILAPVKNTQALTNRPSIEKYFTEKYKETPTVKLDTQNTFNGHDITEKCVVIRSL